MSKIKILMTHVQILSLLRDYDLLWPASTLQALGWADTVNLGVSVAAPECFLPKGAFTFWSAYGFAQGLPLAAVALCAGVHACASAARRRARTDAGRARAAALQARCWKNAFWLLTLLYPRAAQTALQLFSLQRLNVGTFLAADLRILVRPPPATCGGLTCPLTSAFKVMIPVGIAVLVAGAVGVPAFFFLALWRNRKNLDSPAIVQR
jgi:hypothetical protein